MGDDLVHGFQPHGGAILFRHVLADRLSLHARDMKAPNEAAGKRIEPGCCSRGPLALRHPGSKRATRAQTAANGGTMN